MSWTRRVFIKETLRGWLGLVLAPVTYGIVRRWTSSRNVARVEEMSLGSAESFQPGSSRLVLIGTEKVLVGRSMDGSMHAVSGVCTHLGCSIRYVPEGTGAFACNCHESRFDLEGMNLSGPAQKPLRRFEVRVSGGELKLSNPTDAEEA